jgi:hypothetical protein
MKSNSILTLVATILFGGVLVVNALAVFQPLNGLTTGQVASLYPSLFTPAGITFSIWSVIYLLLIGFLILSWQRTDSLLIEKILPWFIASCVLNIAWIIAWHFLFPVISVFIMLGLLAVLIRIFLIIKSLKSDEAGEEWLVDLPFTIYLGWICVATIANVSALLVHIGWTGGNRSQEIWTVVMTAVATLLAVFFIARFRAWAFSLVVFWALIGICLRWETGEHPLIFFSAIVLMAGLTLFIMYRALRNVES